MVFVRQSAGMASAQELRHVFRALGIAVHVLHVVMVSANHLKTVFFVQPTVVSAKTPVEMDIVAYQKIALTVPTIVVDAEIDVLTKSVALLKAV